ncbi:MAG: hypothetical protein GY864_07550, partial [Desulfobacterales bacterium]|nr:hypothetical protein [Desulfobacterales bacterium]
MIIGCDDLESLWGIPFDKLVLYSYWENQWRNIPYQLDDRLPDGRMVFPKGPQANPEDGNLQLDAKDELIFMIRDAGQRKAKDDWPENVKKGVEITIKDPVDKTEGYVYLFHIPDSKVTMLDKQLLATSDAGPQYIGGSHLWSVEGLANEHNGKIYKTLVNEKISTTTLAGGSGKSFLDRMKHRIEVRFLFGMLKLKLNESNMIGEVSQYRGGPLRLSIRSWSQITLPAKLKSPKMMGEVCLYETLTVAPMMIRVPFNPGAVITDFRMSMGYDLNAHAKGMKFYNSNNLNGFTVDGITTDDEKNMNT